MTLDQILRIALKEGVGAVAIIVGIVMLWRLMQFTVIRLTAVIDKLVSKIERFTVNVKNEHELMDKKQEETLTQHKEITSILQSINNRTEKCNK